MLQSITIVTQDVCSFQKEKINSAPMEKFQWKSKDLWSDGFQRIINGGNRDGSLESFVNTYLSLFYKNYLNKQKKKILYSIHWQMQNIIVVLDSERGEKCIAFTKTVLFCKQQLG